MLSAEPAKIPPFNLKVDDALWSVPKNRTPPRPQSTANQFDIVKQITELEKAGIIERSQSTYYSQVLMVPKPDGSKRMCIDYRNLNDCTPDASWPIPDPYTIQSSRYVSQIMYIIPASTIVAICS